MSYTAQKIIETNERLKREYQEELDKLLQGEQDEAVIYKGPVTGLSHYHYSTGGIGSNIKVGEYLIIKPDPTNKYDVNATGLFYKGWQIGWVPKAMNNVCAQAVREKCLLEARVIRHKQFTGDFANILFVEITATRTDSNYEHCESDDMDIEKPFDRFKLHPPTYPPMYPSNAQSQRTKELNKAFNLNQPEQQIMTTTSVNKVLEKNINLGTSAAFLEAGRIASNQLSSVAGKKLPIMVRGYADTAMGRLLLANIAMMAAEHFRPEDTRLRKLTEAMAVSSYQEVLQQFDIEQMIEDMLTNKTIAKALKAVDVAPE